MFDSKGEQAPLHPAHLHPPHLRILTTTTPPDKAFTIKMLSQFPEFPGSSKHARQVASHENWAREGGGQTKHPQEICLHLQASFTSLSKSWLIRNLTLVLSAFLTLYYKRNLTFSQSKYYFQHVYAEWKLICPEGDYRCCMHSRGPSGSGITSAISSDLAESHMQLWACIISRAHQRHLNVETNVQVPKSFTKTHFCNLKSKDKIYKEYKPYFCHSAKKWKHCHLHEIP